MAKTFSAPVARPAALISRVIVCPPSPSSCLGPSHTETGQSIWGPAWGVSAVG
ncbi:hypothetical protein GGTG_06941 [Gaeumannomyces tritici R3-111a-1]|uniref:Uncharacterized protein n=1 Tax=Gaeumannomyces tritici (strain R3-111a-1) TaxID=644352 RepID=J3P094_GAET3|nr:hypothetical protein GGTG_06941 [Gaeumannomyces tritici R3-111a-1]EJT77027.1 hypothetical protein GGTG_06941 [Gaeumannomyces tritici R3-111a-1]